VLVVTVEVMLTVVAVSVSDDDTVVLEAELVEVLLIVVVRTPMQMYCLVVEA
jgi:heme/copper-type cytochrome/quinol oxidase subunit 4